MAAMRIKALNRRENGSNKGCLAGHLKYQRFRMKRPPGEPIGVNGGNGSSALIANRDDFTIWINLNLYGLARQLIFMDTWMGAQPF